jgi:hypothetical protein
MKSIVSLTTHVMSQIYKYSHVECLFYDTSSIILDQFSSVLPISVLYIMRYLLFNVTGSETRD